MHRKTSEQGIGEFKTELLKESKSKVLQNHRRTKLREHHHLDHVQTVTVLPLKTTAPAQFRVSKPGHPPGQALESVSHLAALLDLQAVQRPGTTPCGRTHCSSPVEGPDLGGFADVALSNQEPPQADADPKSSVSRACP